MTVVCCVLSIVAILHQHELREKYGFRGTPVNVDDGVIAGSVVVEFQADPAARPFRRWCRGEWCFPPGLASVPRPFNDGWLEFYERIGLQKPKRELVEPLPTWLEGCRENEIQSRHLRRTQIGMMVRSDGPGFIPIGLTYMPIGPTLFEDGWESFNSALWDSLKIVPCESWEQKIDLSPIRGY
jgi:hypothetical protein